MNLNVPAIKRLMAQKQLTQDKLRQLAGLSRVGVGLMFDYLTGKLQI